MMITKKKNEVIIKKNVRPFSRVKVSTGASDAIQRSECSNQNSRALAVAHVSIHHKPHHKTTNTLKLKPINQSY